MGVVSLKGKYMSQFNIGFGFRVKYFNYEQFFVFICTGNGSSDLNQLLYLYTHIG